MRKFFARIVPFFLLILFASSLQATSWNEPWAEDVIKKADCLVLAKVQEFEGLKATILIEKVLAGKPLSGSINLTDFYDLELCNATEGHGPEFHFERVDEAYFFIRQTDSGTYAIATPTTGFDFIRNGKVYATYRHSYHQALVSPAVYETTMTAIFNHYHRQKFDEEGIREYIKKYIDLKPAGFTPEVIDTFFAQHVALECIYHLNLKGYCKEILPFLRDTSNFHNQVSAARALTTCNDNESKQELLKTLADTATSDFAKVICVRTLERFNPAELKPQLLKIRESASTKENGFGGSLMDPRYCTTFPTVKQAITELLLELK